MARRREEHATTNETSLLPVMNIMLLMIPALLLAMEVARMGAIPVRPPSFADGGPVQSPTDPLPLELRVFIGEDGFEVGSTAGEPPERIGFAAGAAHDYAALEAAARRRHLSGVYVPVVRVDADGSISMSTLVSTLDALRGSECHLAGVAAGEDAPPQCLFWSAIVEPGVRAG